MNTPDQNRCVRERNEKKVRISQEENRTEFNILLYLDRRATIVRRQEKYNSMRESKKTREI